MKVTTFYDLYAHCERSVAILIQCHCEPERHGNLDTVSLRAKRGNLINHKKEYPYDIKCTNNIAFIL